MYTKAVKYFSAVSLNERIRFLKLLFCWKGSVWNLLWGDFLWFFISYIAVTLLYRLYLINDTINKRRFEAIVIYMNKVAELVPLSFLLGFFVSTILGRWWSIINAIPFMTKPAFTCQSLINGEDSVKYRDIRLTIVRYMNLSWLLAMMNMSQKITKRFCLSESKLKTALLRRKSIKKRNVTVREKMDKLNSDEMIQKYFGKLIMEEEILVFENFEKMGKKPIYIVPLMWATKLLEKCMKANLLRSESIYVNLLTMVQNFKTSLGSLAVYNEFNVPLVYTQVIIIVVYIFLISEIMSQQIITVGNNNWETYLPIFGIFKFLIYMGWFKVGLCFINPFGDEQYDLPLDEILDYNLEVSVSVGSAEDLYFPEYLSDSFDDSEGDRFQIFDKFRAFLPSPDKDFNGQSIDKHDVEKHLFPLSCETTT